jgi:hypothetical protein
MFSEHRQRPEMMRHPLRDDQAAGRRAADDLDPPPGHPRRDLRSQSRRALRVGVNEVLVDPAGAVLAGDIDEVIVLQQSTPFAEAGLRCPAPLSCAPRIVVIGSRLRMDPPSATAFVTDDRSARLHLTEQTIESATSGSSCVVSGGQPIELSARVGADRIASRSLSEEGRATLSTHRPLGYGQRCSGGEY